MKTLLNLLPEEKKDALQARLRSRFLLWQLFLLFLLEVFYLVILVSLYLILNFELKSLDAITTQTNTVSESGSGTLATFENEFKETNQSVAVIGAIDRSHLYFSEVFRLIDPLVPNGIVVSRVTTKEYTVSLFGRASTRETLLLFDEELKAEGRCLSDVSIPIQNLFTQKDIDFQVDFQIKPDCLRRKTL